MWASARLAAFAQQLGRTHVGIGQASSICAAAGPDACGHASFWERCSESAAPQLRRRRMGKHPITAPPSPARLGVGGAALLPRPLLPMPGGALLAALLGARLGPRLAARARVASECRPRAQSTSANQGCCRTSSAPAWAPNRCVGSCNGMASGVACSAALLIRGAFLPLTLPCCPTHNMPNWPQLATCRQSAGLLHCRHRTNQCTKPSHVSKWPTLVSRRVMRSRPSADTTGPRDGKCSSRLTMLSKVVSRRADLRDKYGCGAQVCQFLQRP